MRGKNKTYTILISSNDRGVTRRITLSSAWVKTWISLMAVFLVVLSAGGLDYLGLLLQTSENKRLKSESELLKRQFNVVESKVETLEKSLERVKIFSKKLRLITNVEDENRSLDLAVSQGVSGDKEDTYEDQERNPAAISSVVQTDSLFLQRPALDSLDGELVKMNTKEYATLSIRIDKSVRRTHLTEQSVLELYETLNERQSLLRATPSIRPTRGWYTSQFGYRRDPITQKAQMHNGLDLAASPGTPVYAPADGVVSYVGYEPGYGRIVSIDHGFGVVTRYAHNSQTYVEVGQKINRRDVISAVGNTGRSTGPHLHYEIRVHGIPVDPKNYILD